MSELVTSESLGPQRSADTPFARRLRFHQSWYRVAVLNQSEFGSSPGRDGRPLGSALSAAAASAGLNFTSEEAMRLYERRRRLGWGVDPTRCTTLMTSSQAMMFNLLGPLSDDPTWLARLLGRVLGRQDIVGIASLDLEFAPSRRSEHLGDQTRIDGLVGIGTPMAVELVALEIKYTDRFSSRKVDLAREPYRSLAERHSLWRDPTILERAGSLNQLIRVHALATSAGARRGVRPPITLLVVGHQGDAKTWATTADFRQEMSEPDRLVTATLDSLLDGMAATASHPDQVLAVEPLRRRYVGEDASHAAWQRFGLSRA